MKPRYESASDESDDDAPEAVNLSQAKKDVKQQASALRQFQSQEKEKKREKNRLRDRKLKEQAANKKGKQVAEEEDEEDADDGDSNDEDGVVARMRKAMQDAEGEDSDAEMEEGFDLGDYEGMAGGESSEDDEEEFHGFDASEQRKLRANPNHLPDHLFTSAFASQSKAAPSSTTKSKAQQHKEKQKARKRLRTKPKDVIIGSRVMRSLTDTETPSGKSTMGPSANARKFLDRSLKLKSGSKVRQRGWERRPASVGSLRTGGPAARFVRS